MPDRTPFTDTELRKIADFGAIALTDEPDEDVQAMAAEMIAARARIAELETEARNMSEGLKSFLRVIDVASEFVNERPEYVTACRNAHPDNAHDYYRWQGGAEARRQLAQRLGWTVPHEIGEKTTPIEEAGQ